MSHERAVDEIVTTFFLDTCRLRPLLTRHAVQAAWCCAETVAQHPVNDAEAGRIPLTTGSAAEFYIEPMLPLCGDIDVMFHWSTDLAIPRGHPPPTQLPAEFSNYVQVMEIVDSHLPGYVYLELRYLLTECIEDCMHRSTTYDGKQYLSNHSPSSVAAAVHGPALLTNFTSYSCLLTRYAA